MEKEIVEEKVIKCEVCGEECDGKLTVICPPDEKLTVCKYCLNDFGNQDYDSLTNKLEKNPRPPKPKYLEEEEDAEETD